LNKNRLSSDTQGQAVVEWAILIIPLVFLLFIPYEFAQRYHTRTVLMGGVRYHSWDQAANRGPAPNTSSAINDILENYAAGVDPTLDQVTSPGPGNPDSGEAIGGSFLSGILGALSSLGVTAGGLFMWSDKDNTLSPDLNSYGNENWFKVRAEASYETEIGEMLNAFAKLWDFSSSQGSNENVNLTGFRDSVIGNPWYPGFKQNGTVNEQDMEDHVRDAAWGIGLPVLGQLVTTLLDVMDAIKSVIQAVPAEIIGIALDIGHESYHDKNPRTTHLHNPADEQRGDYHHPDWLDPRGIVYVRRVPKPTT
jgi:hypothetical protein